MEQKREETEREQVTKDFAAIFFDILIPRSKRYYSMIIAPENEFNMSKASSVDSTMKRNTGYYYKFTIV